MTTATQSDEVRSVIDDVLAVQNAIDLANREITAGVLGEVAAERARQNAKWGIQNHPDVVPGADDDTYDHIPSGDVAKAYCQANEDGSDNWLDILCEEFCEARDEAVDGNVEALRKELVQVAAVAVNWIESIDRRTA